MSSKKVQEKRKITLFLFFTLSLFAVDQVSKKLILLYILPGSSIPFLSRFIRITPVKNEGTIVGFFPALSHFIIFFAIFVLIIFVLVWLLKLKKKSHTGLAFIIAGAGGNLFDRVLKGGVVDFIDVGFWPIFNLADVFIVPGVFLTSIHLIFLEKNV